MRAVILTGLFGFLGACATHNSHRVDFDPKLDLEPLVGEALDELVDDYREPLPEKGVAFALHVDEVPVVWRITSGGTETLEGPEEFLARVEREVTAKLGNALVPQEELESSDLRLDVFVYLDLHQIDDVGVYVEGVLTHKDRPRRVLAHGGSFDIRLPRLRCFGCRDHWTRRKGTRIGPNPYGYYQHHHGWYGGWSFGFGAVWGSGWGGSRSTYTKVD